MTIVNTTEKPYLKPYISGALIYATDEERIHALVEAISAYTKRFYGGEAAAASFDGETLKVRLSGACLGCPLSPETLHAWIEGAVKLFFPDVKRVEVAEAVLRERIGA